MEKYRETIDQIRKLVDGINSEMNDPVLTELREIKKLLAEIRDNMKTKYVRYPDWTWYPWTTNDESNITWKPCTTCKTCTSDNSITIGSSTDDVMYVDTDSPQWIINVDDAGTIHVNADVPK